MYNLYTRYKRIYVLKKKTFKECINFELLNNQLALGKGNFKFT